MKVATFPHTRYNRLDRDIHLLFSSFREFVYSFTYSKDKKIKISPFDPTVRQTGLEIVQKIKNVLPDSTIHFTGSAVLGIAGQRDLDIYVESAPKDLKKNLEKLIPILGQATKIRAKFVEWHSIIDTCDVEVILADPQLPILRDPVHTFNLIKSNLAHIKEYEQLKLASNGVSEREYKRRKLEFFHRIEK